MRRIAAVLLAAAMAVGCQPTEEPDVLDESVQALCQEMEQAITAREIDITIESDFGRQFEELWALAKLDGETFEQLDGQIDAACGEAWTTELEIGGQGVTYRGLSAGFVVVEDGCDAVPSGLVEVCD